MSRTSTALKLEHAQPGARPGPEAVSSAESPLEALEDLRREIDALDGEILDLLTLRLEMARRTAPLKASAGLPIRDTRREARVLRQVAAGARERGLDVEAVRDIYWRLLGVAVAAQGDALR